MLSGIPSVSSKHVKAGPLGLFGATVVTKLLRVWVEECRVYRPSSPDPIKDKKLFFSLLVLRQDTLFHDPESFVSLTE